MGVVEECPVAGEFAEFGGVARAFDGGYVGFEGGRAGLLESALEKLGDPRGSAGLKMGGWPWEVMLERGGEEEGEEEEHW